MHDDSEKNTSGNGLMPMHHAIKPKQPSQYCLCCGAVLEGRSDKKFCNAYCRSQHHYLQRKSSLPRIFVFISKQLKTNRRILAAYNKAGKATVRREVLLNQGFLPRVFTHYWRSSTGNLYFFVYEYGFMAKDEHGQKKFVIIQWQPYMHDGALGAGSFI